LIVFGFSIRGPRTVTLPRGSAARFELGEDVAGRGAELEGLGADADGLGVLLAAACRPVAACETGACGNS
jgi:hypothetical protein